MQKDEIERKFQISIEKKEKIIEYLKQEHFEFQGKKQIIDDYYIVKENDEYLRIRHSDPATLDHHKMISDDTCKEISVPVLDKQAMAHMLNKLGFALQIVVDKTRETYSNTKVEVVLDYIEGFGHFIEIEVYDGIREDMNNLVTQLSLTDEVKKQGYPDLLINAKKEKK